MNSNGGREEILAAWLSEGKAMKMENIGGGV